MKLKLLVFLGTALLLFSTVAQTFPVQAAGSDKDEPYSGAVLCQPDAYLSEPGDCLPLGPSVYLTDLAKKGISFPPAPLPAVTPDSSLNNVDINYAKINVEASERVALYRSLEEAAAGTNPSNYLPAGNLRYVSFTQTADVNGGHFVELHSGEWLRASPAAATHVFQGLQFNQTPRNNFGWIIDNCQSRSAPGYESPETGKTYIREALVQVYDIKETPETTWYMVGMSEWIEYRYLHIVKINTTPPQGITGDRWIEVNLYQQTMAVYDKRELVFATLIATGIEPFYTQPGLFQIREKKPTETMTGAFEKDKSDYYYLEDVPWTMYFDHARALHGAYWRAMFGYPQSHGCVNLSIGDSRWLFDWANVGDWVYVWDPSGKTPTDPAAYSDGGA
jgi:hypothetical protein